jgi:ribosomal protein S18 acetylase RimI-like enzyme
VSARHERLLRDAYEAFNARDIERALTLMHVDVDWPNALEGGRVRGREGVQAYWERQFEAIDSQVRPLRIEQAPDGRMVVTVHQLVRDRAGKLLSDQTVEHRYVITEGLIERMDVGDRPTIRGAIEEDVASVLDLWEAAGGPVSVTDTREGLLGLLSTDRDALLIAESGGSVVGSLIAAWDGWRGGFYKLVVGPDYRRRGLATELLRAGERHLRARGAVRLTAIVVEDDLAAMGFWQTAGYERQQNRTRWVRRLDA